MGESEKDGNWGVIIINGCHLTPLPPFPSGKGKDVWQGELGCGWVFAMSESTQQHRKQAKTRGSVSCVVLTVSDTRTLETDRGGALVAEHLTAAGHTIVDRQIVIDDFDLIQNAIRAADAQAVILTGGTGITERDVTPDAVEGLLDRKMDGFGELFRMLSWEEIGPASMLSRAVGGRMDVRIVLAIPGSTAAVRLAMEKLICPELHHLVYEANK